MKRLVAALFLIALHPIASKAQSNFKPGIVVTTAGDTLKGFINYQEWNQTPTAIQYATSTDGNERQEFNAQTAQYIEITGLEAFKRYKGPITMNELDVRKLTSDRGLRLTDAEVFLKAVTQGENVALLSYTDQVKTRFFVQEKGNGLPQELYLVKYYTQDVGNKVFTMKSYSGQLQILASRYIAVTPALKREIETAGYDAKSFQNIVQKVNGNTVAESALELKQKNKPRFYAGIGLNRSVLQFKGENDMAGATSNPASYMPRLTLGVDAFVNRNTQRLLLRLEGALTASGQTFKNSGNGTVYDYERTYVIAQQTASLSPQVIYNVYNTEDFKYYVGGGFGLNVSNYSKNNYTYTSSYTDNTGKTTYGPQELESYKLETVWASYMVQTGMVLKKRYEIIAMYQPAAKLTKYFDFSVEQQAMSLGVNYLFGK